MEIVLAVLGVAFTAFAIWLTVRLVNRRERWAARTALVLAFVMMPSLYVLGIGPVTWLYWRKLGKPAWMKTVFEPIYEPLGWAANNGPSWFRDAILWYCEWWAG